MRIRKGKLETSNRCGSHGPYMDLICLEVWGLSPMVNNLGGEKVKLNIRMGYVFLAADESSSLKMSRGGSSCLVEEPLEANLDHA